MRAVKRQQSARVTHLEVAREEHLLHRLAQLEQAQQIGRRAARTADRACRGLVRHAEFLGQTMQAARLLERIQVLALDVLDQRHRRRRFVRDLADEHRDDVEAGEAGGADAPLAGDDLVALRPAAGVGERSNEDRLHHSLRLDAFGELVQRFLVDPRARLKASRLESVERQRVRLAFGGRCRDGVDDAGAEQGFQAHPETLRLLRHHRPRLSRHRGRAREASL